LAIQATSAPHCRPGRADSRWIWSGSKKCPSTSQGPSRHYAR
jgi:hypothetical protein